MQLFIPDFLAYWGHAPTVPQPGNRLIYNPTNRTFRINSGGFRLQYVDETYHWRWREEWRPYPKMKDWIRAAVDVAGHFNLHIEQYGSTRDGHPIFYLRA